MSAGAALLLVAVAAAAALMVAWSREHSRHAERLAQTPIRIHVNGIRGKSTVTRLIAGALREAGIETVAKTTGTAAAVILADGSERSLRRRGAASILEQIDVVARFVRPSTAALVMECMALKPAYQDVAERKMVRSTIGVITNVREDHQDVMGETLEEIARSLMSTCPRDGMLVTAEQNPKVLAVMREGARARGTRLLVVDPGEVSDAQMARFPYLAFKENVAIAIAVARLAGVDDQHTALNGMVAAAPDPGVTRLRTFRERGKEITWANLFAVNDRESTVAVVDRLVAVLPEGTTTVGILNNRLDRGRRALQFADIAALDLQFDYLVTFGAYERCVTARLTELGFPAERVLGLGDDAAPSLDQILERICGLPGERLFLAGMVNIHTPQAELLLEHFEEAPRLDHYRLRPAPIPRPLTQLEVA